MSTGHCDQRGQRWTTQIIYMHMTTFDNLPSKNERSKSASNQECDWKNRQSEHASQATSTENSISDRISDNNNKQKVGKMF